MELKTEIIVTETAKEHLLKQTKDHAGARLYIKEGKGCGGFEYELELVSHENINDGDDYIVISEELKLFISPLDLMRLFGTRIDFIKDKLGNSRLDILNPNESGQCGCGMSVTFD